MSEQQQFNQTGIENSTFGDRAQISIEQKIILPFVPKQVRENPHNLPNSGVAQFVGRAEVLTQLARQLQQSDRVAISTLTGMGGLVSRSWRCSMVGRNGERKPIAVGFVG